MIRAIGAGMNQSAMLARFAREGDFDVFLVAGRYTLLDQDALAELLPLCVERGVAILIGGVMNSGVLADPRPGAPFDYRPRRPASSIARAGSPRSAIATASRSARPRSSSRSPTRRSRRSDRRRPARRPPRRVPGAHARADPGGPLGRPAGRRACIAARARRRP